MSFIDPQANPTGLAPGDEGLPPLISNLPSAVKSFRNRYNPTAVGAMRKQFDPEIVNSFLAFERKRAMNGQSPLSVETAVGALRSAQTHRASTKPPERDPLDILGNVASDVGDIVTSIPKMPGQFVEDVRDAPKALEALGSGDPSKILTAPLVRMIPGTYTLNNLISGDFNEILTHPVMTGLDVLPYWQKLGLTAKLGELPTGSATLGERVNRMTQSLGRTTAGQFAREAWSPEVRNANRILAEQPNIISQKMNPVIGKIFDDAESSLAREGVSAGMELRRAIPDEARQGEIMDAIERDQLETVNPTDAERAAVYRFTNSVRSFEMHGIDAGHLAQRTIDGTTETYTPAQAAKIDKVRGRFARRETLTELREAISEPANADITALGEKVHEQLARPDLPLRQRRSLAAGYVHALDAAGYDTGSLLSDVGRANKGSVGGLLLDDTGSDRSFPKLDEGTLRTRRRSGSPALEPSTRWLEEHRTFTRKALERDQRAVGAVEAKQMPARWQPLFQDLKMDRAKGWIEQTLDPTDPSVPALLEAVNEHVYSGIDKKIIKQIDNEVMQSIAELRRNGVNPQFVHHVSEAQARMMDSPSITTIIPKASQYAARLNDWTPHSNSLSVSITHQGLELLRAQGARAGLDAIKEAHVVSYNDVVNELRPVAQRIAARTGKTVGEELETLARKEYVRWSDTENGFMAGDAKPFKFSEASFMEDAPALIHKSIARSLERLAKPPTYSRIFDPALKVFRTSVLPLSIRFHVNNIAGGAIMGALEDPRFLARVPEGMKFAKEISDINRAISKGVDVEMSAGLEQLLREMPESMRAELGSFKYNVAPDTDFKLKAGAKMGELAQKSGVDRIIKAGGRAVDWSYQWNELVDTGYRIGAYLSEHDNALKKGLTAEEAGARGMALANKFMPRWLEMTPMERSVFRVVMPFYSFTSHMFRYAFRFPHDHPWRTAVMANLARTELDDFGTGLPQALASAFFLGDPDKKGNQKVIDIGAANPFRDLGDNMTLAGFLGQTNPVFKTMLRMAGYDPQSRGPNLYPEITYDPKTGRLKAANPNATGLLGQLVTDFVPQANIVAALTGTSSEFKQLLRANPDAAQRMLMSSAGVPLIYKSVNVPEQAFKAEVTRSEQQKMVLSQAMKTGNYAAAMKWPQLVPIVQQLQKLQAQQKLLPYQPGQGSKNLTQAEVKNG